MLIGYFLNFCEILIQFNS